MKYRSYNSELVIATSLIVNVFNDIIIDRRKHNIKDYSKPLSFDDVVQQEIEIPCVLGDRSIILKSLENEPGRYKLPLIILQNKALKTDTDRMCDLHADVFYQQDSSFGKLDSKHHLYSAYDISKRRAQPVIIDYDLTIITKYKEDLDQIISNWIVHFRPDIYFKWWHPKNKTEPLTSQLTWAHNLSFDLPIEYNPQNIFTYKSTTSFSFKTWIFPGMNLDRSDGKFFDPDKGIIKSFKFFTNRSKKLHHDENPDKESVDMRDDDNFYVFGDIENKQAGSLQFWNVEQDQGFVYDGKDEQGLREGKYVVNNIFNENYSEISGDALISNIKTKTEVGDFFSSDDSNLTNKWQKYQNPLTNDSSIYPDNKSIFKAVYFKGGFNEDDLYGVPASGDFLFNYFYKTYTNNKKAKSEFGNSMIEYSKVNVSYDIETKNLNINSINDLTNFKYEMNNILNSRKGVVYDFSLKSKLFKEHNIEFAIHKEYDSDYKENYKASKIITNNINLINGQYNLRSVLFLISDQNELSERTKIINGLTSFWKSVNLIETHSNKYRIEIEDPKYGDYIKAKRMENILYRDLNVVQNIFKDGFYYQVLMNNYIYIVLKIDANDENLIDIFDIGKFIPMTFMSQSAPIFEITIPESKMLLGLNVFMKY